MSTLVAAIASTGLMARRVRAYFAPVNRMTGTPTIFDPSLAAGFQTAMPPPPWIDLGWIFNFERKSIAKIEAATSGSPSIAQYQVRQSAGATVSFAFEQWMKLTMALAAGSEHMNVLVPAAGSLANGSGGAAGIANTILFSGTPSTSGTMLRLSAADLTSYSAGMLIAVDVDYTGGPGFVGTGISGAYVKTAASVGNDPDYIRRVTFNVARVQQVTGQGLLLAQTLPAGTPTAGMKVQPVLGFVDREGGSFLQEWSALFVVSGEQGDAVFFHYPRLQPMQGAAEAATPLQKPIDRWMLNAAFRALPVVDGVDGQQIFCFRTYVPAPSTMV